MSVPTLPAHANGVHPPPATEPPDDGLPPFSEDFLAGLREMDWLDGEYNAGRLAPYYDEYVIAANHTILAHSRNLDTAYTEAERKADELGIPRGRLTNYFCACS